MNQAKENIDTDGVIGAPDEAGMRGGDHGLHVVHLIQPAGGADDGIDFE